ncbi:MAG TPA: 23S rRNA (uracil(1939)-C(5))-methyltransferase RlmD [Bacteroidetes bacterium]|nr:23S rRNA (uracil(1939)-C(5))-methyltransferase RlmD [Bacteroidota bacterium]
MLNRGDELQLTVEGAAFEGKTVSRINGFVVFVEGAVPGDVVNARIQKVKKSYAEAKVLSVAQPSPLRTQPRCKHFGVCGGCKWQHVEYQAQLRFKQQHVVDAFERIGGFSNLRVLPIIGSNDVYFYRNKMEYSFSDRQWLEHPPAKLGADHLPEGEGEKLIPADAENVSSIGSLLLPEIYLGLHVPQRYDKVLNIEECHLQSHISNQILSFARVFARKEELPVYSSKTETGYLRFLVIRQSRHSHEIMVNLVTLDDRGDVMTRFTLELTAAIPQVTTVVNTINSKKAQIASGEVEKIYHGDGVIHEKIGKHSFTISAGSFFQTNTLQAETLYGVAKALANLQPSDVVWDLYSGTGSIALFVSDSCKEVVGIESAESAVQDARRNAAANAVENCRFVLGDLKDRLTKDVAWMESHSKPDILIIDPPRSGMHPKVVEEISQLAPRRIVYVSCNPATQARDVKMLCAEKYDLHTLQPVDMFPHTYHVENVCLLNQRS